MSDEIHGDNISVSSTVRHNDGNLEVVQSADGMQALANLTPPVGAGAALSIDYVRELLTRMGIVEGILWDELTEAIFTLNTERKPIRDFVIAKGLEAAAEYPEHIKLETVFTQKKQINQEANRIDWHDLSGITLVKKGQKVATVVPKQEGKPGLLVSGQELPFSKANISNYVPGKNLVQKDMTILAACDGRLIIEGTKFSVEEVLQVKGDVDFHIGHISFPGDVIIDGCINAGFRVYSGGSILIKETTDAFDIQAKCDINCGLGIIGKTPGMVRAGGNLQAKFIENARVAVRNDIDVSGAIVGSHIYTLGKLKMGDKGRIVGGEIFARNGIQCGWLGGKSNPLTQIHVGVDFTLQQKLEQANNALQILSMKFQRLVNALKVRQDPALQKLHDETETKLHNLAQSIAELAQRVNSNESAAVEVMGGIYPGVTISICQIVVTIEKPMKKTRFRLDQTAGKLVIENK